MADFCSSRLGFLVVNILFDSPPLSISDYDGNVGCVGTAFEIPVTPPSPAFLAHVGNTAQSSQI